MASLVATATIFTTAHIAVLAAFAVNVVTI